MRDPSWPTQQAGPGAGPGAGSVPGPGSVQGPTPGPTPGPQDAPLEPRAPTAAQAQQVRYLPPPTGPNWGLLLTGLCFVAIAAGVLANQVSGFQVGQLTHIGPGVLVGVGLLCAVFGIVGMLRRRRH